MDVLVNICLYQVGWFACVFGAATGHPWLGMSLALGLIAVHLGLSAETRRQLTLMTAAGIIGLTIDTLQLWWGVFRFPNGTIVPWLAPLWVVVLWIQFATILPFSLRWLSNRYGLSAVLGFIGGPLAYYAGEAAGAVVFLAPRFPHFLIVGLFWSLALPAVVWVSDRLDLVAILGRRYRFQRSRSIVHPHRVVIIGGGFAGLSAALGFRRSAVDVTLVDRRNFHLFQPLLYQVATGGLSPANISAPLRSVLKRQKNARVLLGEACDFDLANRRVILTDGALDYDTLVVATGATHHYFGNYHWESLAPGLKTIEDATDIRRRVFLAFEAAERAERPGAVQELLTFVVVGGGPTGVELAGIETDRAGRIPVEPDLTLAGYPEVFVIGDMASFACGPGKSLPGVAPVAIQQGKHVARTIRHRLQHKPTPPFRYRDYGTMATIGRRGCSDCT